MSWLKEQQAAETLRTAFNRPARLDIKWTEINRCCVLWRRSLRRMEIADADQFEWRRRRFPVPETDAQYRQKRSQIGVTFLE